jgi:hypothetical protein
MIGLAADTDAKPRLKKPQAGALLTTAEVAAIFRVAVETVRGWIATGELVAINTAAKDAVRPRFVIEPVQVERFKQARSTVQAAVMPSKPISQRKTRDDRKHYIRDP